MGKSCAILPSSIFMISLSPISLNGFYCEHLTRVYEFAFLKLLIDKSTIVIVFYWLEEINRPRKGGHSTLQSLALIILNGFWIVFFQWLKIYQYNENQRIFYKDIKSFKPMARTRDILTMPNNFVQDLKKQKSLLGLPNPYKGRIIS